MMVMIFVLAWSVGLLEQFGLQTNLSIGTGIIWFAVLTQTSTLIFTAFLQRHKSVRLNFRIPRNFGPPHLHVSGGFEDRGITQ